MTLADLYHYIGGDLSTAPSGDLLTATGTMRGQQRVLRRLLTNPGDYIFHPNYGAGLPSYVGRTADVAKIRALVRGQMQLESAVARSPAPDVNVAPIPSADGGGFSIQIRYVDAPSGEPVALSFSVKR